MDENSCKSETADGIETSVDAPKPDDLTEDVSSLFRHQTTDFRSGPSGIQVSDRCGSSFDASGPSDSFLPPTYEEENDTLDVTEESGKITPHQCSSMSSYEDARQDSQPHVRMAPDVEEPSSGRMSVGPPPSYSFVMKQKRKVFKPLPEVAVSDRPPPPNYGNTQRGFYMTSEYSRFSEPMWRSHSQPALCPRCGILVLTNTHSHDSVATHVAALALCLFGCWPCCLLPYCVKVCKNTYHHCPICQTFLGSYSPW